VSPVSLHNRRKSKDSPVFVIINLRVFCWLLYLFDIFQLFYSCWAILARQDKFVLAQITCSCQRRLLKQVATFVHVMQSVAHLVTGEMDHQLKPYWKEGKKNNRLIVQRLEYWTSAYAALFLYNLKGSGVGVQNSESLGLWTLSIVHNYK
jgi:hypothetical protein